MRQGHERVSSPSTRAIHLFVKYTLTSLDFRSAYNTEHLDSSRATINMVHDKVSLKVSQDQAAKADDEAKRRLLASGKLSLVVDLDQTIIHATVDPTVADWQKDVEHPNHNAVKDVRAFLLKDDGPKREGCWYYIKLRPNLEAFLENISQIYECHIYTMGTRAYAKEIAELVDPQHKIFGNRILSRDESGSMTAKNLQRLFPVDTKMVVIIDDRGDVWKWSPNLIKVTPYDFFVGIGDINSSFLPKKQGPRPSSKAAAISAPKPNIDLAEGAAQEEPEPKTNGNSDQASDATSIDDLEPPNISDASPLEQLVAMGGNDDDTARRAQTSLKEEAVAEQLKERPLLQKQLQLEAEDAATGAASTKEEGNTDNVSPSTDVSSDLDKPKHNLLQDHDRELYILEDSLRKVHTEFYRIFDKQKASTRGGRLGEIHGGQKRKFSNEQSELDLVPDIKNVLPAVKARVLAGVVIVFSGLVPLGVDIDSTDIAILAMSFGARIEEKVNRNTTHVVAARNRTLKVRKALKRGKGKIKIVTLQWLHDSVNSWQKKDEMAYLLDVEEGRSGHPGEDDDILSESESPADTSEGEETDSAISKKSIKPSLTIDPPSSEAGDTASDIDDDDLPPELDPTSPVGGHEGTWGDMNDEVEDFLADLADDSDGESVASGNSHASSRLSVRGKKRGRQDDDSGGESDDSTIKPKKKQALANGLTSLSQTSNLDSEQSEDDKGVNGDAGVEGEETKEEGDGWDDFDEDEFEEELQKAGSEDQGDG